MYPEENEHLVRELENIIFTAEYLLQKVRSGNSNIHYETLVGIADDLNDIADEHDEEDMNYVGNEYSHLDDVFEDVFK
jgi:hypothetical protein